MKNKLFSIGGGFLALTLVLASSSSVYAQEEPQSLKKNAVSITTESSVEKMNIKASDANSHQMRRVQLPAAYYQPSWTVVSERIDGVGAHTVSGINADSFQIPNTANVATVNRPEQDQVFDNGPHFNVPGTPDLSLLESVTLEMGTFGANISYPDFAAADDFELTAETEITSIDFYSYQTGASGTSINAAYVQIWDGDPSGSGTVIWGDMSTNVFSSVESSGAYRVSETAQADRSRLIQRVTVNITDLTLDAGTYYIEYSLGGTVASGPWQAPVVILGEDTTGDALQRTTTGWQAMLDSGNNTPQGVPFQIYGNENDGGGGTFPEPYCDIEDGDDVIVEAITTVEFAGVEIVNNDYNAVLVDKTDIVVDVTAGETYTISVQGDTSGNFETNIVAFIDWNQNGILDDAGEVYEIGVLENSTGNDGVSVTAEIEVPADALAGQTRVRITKTYFDEDSDPIINPCGIQFDPWGMGVFSSFGQALDFTVDVETDTGDGCEWTVIVEEDYFGDEVAWELRTMDGVVLLSGGDYGDSYYDEQTVTAEGPLEFWITNDGFFADNTPNYSVSNGTQVLVSGTMPNGGDTLTFSDLNCEGGDDPTPPGDDCDIDFAMSLDNGIGNLQTLLLADDFVVASGTIMTVDRVTYRIFNNIGQATRIVFFENDNGLPGNIVEEFNNISPESQTIVGNNYGFNAYDVTFDLPNSVELAAGTYWLGLQVTAGSDGGTNYWVITDEGIGSAGHYSSDGGTSWVQTTDLNDFSFKVEGQCEDDDDPTPPGDDCDIDFAMSLDNGIGNLQTLLLADDFVVASGTIMTVDRVTYRIFNNIGQATRIVFFENNNGLPGNIVEEFNNISPESQTIVGNNYGFNAYDVVFDLPDSVELAAGTYWLGLQVTAGSDGGTNYWVITDEGIGSAGHYSSDGGVSWVQTTDLNDFSFKVEGQCEDGGDPGLTYCEPSLDCTDGDVITNVTFQEIDNDSGCSPNGYGDYTSLVATVQSGGTYPISVTVGDGWANESVSVWIDFDNSGTFDEDEFFYIGTGSDEPLVDNIEIPVSVADGQYRMRVRVAAVGAGTATWDMSCDESQGYGETEDYTVQVDGTVGIDDQNQVSFTYYPNPTTGIVNIESNRDITNFAVYNILGQEVLNGNHLDNDQVNLSSVTTGTYIFRVTFEDGSVETFKVVRE